MPLPDRQALLDRLGQIITTATVTGAGNAGADERAPAVFLIEIEGYDQLEAIDTSGVVASGSEVVRRMDRLVRSTDVLGRTEPGRYVLLAATLKPAAAGAVMERIRSVFAMPLDLGDTAVALSVRIAVEFCTQDPDGSPADPAEVLERAEGQLRSDRD